MNKFYTLFVLIILISSLSFAQGGSIKFGPGGGLTFLLSPGDFTDDIDTVGSNYGFKSNYNIGAKFKGTVTGVPLNFYGKLLYTVLSGSQDNIITNVGGTQVASDYETDGSIFTIALGGEYLLAPAPISPYLNLDIQLNSLGDLDFSRLAGGQTFRRSTELGTRFGIGFGAGIDLTISQVTIDAGLNFNFPNLIGQDEGESTISALNFTIFILYAPL